MCLVARSDRLESSQFIRGDGLDDRIAAIKILQVCTFDGFTLYDVCEMTHQLAATFLANTNISVLESLLDRYSLVALEDQSTRIRWWIGSVEMMLDEVIGMIPRTTTPQFERIVSFGVQQKVMVYVIENAWGGEPRCDSGLSTFLCIVHCKSRFDMQEEAGRDTDGGSLPPLQTIMKTNGRVVLVATMKLNSSHHLQSHNPTI